MKRYSKQALFWFASLLLAACTTIVPPLPAGSIPPPTQQATVVATYDNPIYPGDFPDPFVLRLGDEYYAYATNAGDTNVQTLWLSEDFAEYEWLGDALPRLPRWAAWHQSLTWAPAVLPRGDRFVLYFTARYIEADKQCIGRAVGDEPAGPFIDDSDEPLVCQVELGGSIDPSPFVDEDGQAYLLWKNDGNCCGLPTRLWIQPLQDDGLALEGEPVMLIERDQLWEHPLIEAPAMVRYEDRYYLFYSGNWWESHAYAIGYAVCETPTGPCVKPQRQPLFQYTPQTMGPGGQEFFRDEEGALWMAYHAWSGPNVGYPEGSRSLRVEPVVFVDGVPVIAGPTTDPQPLP